MNADMSVALHSHFSFVLYQSTALCEALRRFFTYHPAMIVIAAEIATTPTNHIGMAVTPKSVIPNMIRNAARKYLLI